MKLLNQLKKLILDCLFPIECLACSQANFWFCPECFKKLNFKSQQNCLFCNRVMPAGQTCPNCQKYYFLDGAFIAGDYKNPLLADLIKKFKFSGLTSLAEVLSNFLAAALIDYEKNWPEFLEVLLPQAKRYNILKKFLNNKPLLIPIPISRQRQARRGYNQCELLASALVKTRPQLSYSRALQKIRHTPAQSSLKIDQRFNNLNNSFIWQGENLAGQGILLLDDIATTGATLETAARTLKEAGAEKIWGLILAKG